MAPILPVMVVLRVFQGLGGGALTATGQAIVAEIPSLFFLAFIIFLVAGVAELNRTPFDLPEAEAEWNRGIQQALSKTVWANDCHSWYKDGRGHIFSLWPHGTSRFIREMQKAPLDEYRFS